MSALETADLLLEMRGAGIIVGVLNDGTMYTRGERPDQQDLVDKIWQHKSDIVMLHHLYTTYLYLRETKLDEKERARIARRLGIPVEVKTLRLGSPFKPGFNTWVKKGEPIEFPDEPVAPKPVPKPATHKETTGNNMSAFKDAEPAAKKKRTSKKTVPENQASLF